MGSVEMYSINEESIFKERQKEISRAVLTSERERDKKSDSRLWQLEKVPG